MFTLFLIFFLIIAFLLLFVMASSLVGFVMTGVPFVRTRGSDIAVIVSKLSLSKKDVFYELGSGDGKVVFLIEKLSGAAATGFELTWWTYLWAKLRKRIKGSHAEFSNSNFFKTDWRPATVIYGYLYPPLMRRVEEKFLEDCNPGTWAVIRDFPFPTLKYTEKIYLPGDHELYFYKRQVNELQFEYRSGWKYSKDTKIILNYRNFSPQVIWYLETCGFAKFLRNKGKILIPGNFEALHTWQVMPVLEIRTGISSLQWRTQI